MEGRPVVEAVDGDGEDGAAVAVEGEAADDLLVHGVEDADETVAVGWGG